MHRWWHGTGDHHREVVSASVVLDKEDLVAVANQTMPFGKFKGKTLIDLPEGYLLWFGDRGFPTGHLGELMQLTLEIKINGQESLVEPLRQGR